MNHLVNILFVEDDEGHLALIRRIFADLGTFHSVASLEAARRAIESACPDVMVVDVALPDGRGTDLLGSPDSVHPCPIIVLTSQGDEMVAVEAMKRGAFDYVVKSPETIRDLPRIVDRAVREWRLRQEHQQALAALRDSERKYRAVVTACHEAIVRLRPGGIIDTWNPAAARIFGYSAEDAIGRDYRFLVPPDKRAEREQFEGDLAAGRSVLGVRTERLTSSGDRIHVSLNLTPLFDDEGQTTGACATVEDVTARVEAEQALRRREAEMAHAARLSTMCEMVGGIAHEINQPLTAISNYAAACGNLAAEVGGDQADKLCRWLDGIESSAIRAGQIIRRLREFVRRGTPRSTATNLADVIRESVELASPAAQSCRVAVRIANPLPDAVVRIDCIQVQQVLINVLNNAFEALQEVEPMDRRVELSAAVRNQAVQIRVQDCGPGLPTGDPTRIFDPFYTTKPKGMGIGLAICQTIIEAHGGRIWAGRSGAEGGAVFFIQLPLDQPVDSEPTKAGDSDPSRRAVPS